ncbi:hypothetical protein BRADI_2g15835v3 [Brachypodium distachyon]|uniref:Myb/SANT-like domain-containing protein n=1 Tax=Brachypodium distachyon TaxID=15368 RepID=A0A0Q3K212_BRADI|nr:hypothetical protein BRADI_2g15835v3 [Brachypodium distachyon]
MAGNNVVWQPQVVEEMLRYYKEKIQAEGRQLVFKETHREECAKQINAKFSTNFTYRQVYHKFHKLKGQWKVILEAKSLSGANFDDVHKIILYDETEVVQMKNHATGEFTVLQTPFENTCAEDNDFIGDKSATNGEADPGTHHDSDCLPEELNNECSSSKRATGGKRDKGKRVRRDDVNLFKIIDDMKEYPLLMRLALQTALATNGDVAVMLKGRPMSSIQEYVRQWIQNSSSI